PQIFTLSLHDALPISEFQNKAWWIPSLSLFAAFYATGGGAIVCRTSTNGQTWTSATTIISASIFSGNVIDFWFSGSTIYYARVTDRKSTRLNSSHDQI